MVRLLGAAALFVATVAVLFGDLPSSVRTWTYWTLPLSGKIIALDAGHGGVDGGATGRNGMIEKDINLAIALYLRDYLQQAGALVIMTREGDYDLASSGTRGTGRRKTEDLHARVERIRRAGAELTVSIHLNSVPSAKWRGAQTFFSDRHPDSQRLAHVIQRELRETLGNTERVALKADEVFLLKELDMPSALVEVGFLSNPEEARLLGDPDYQRKVAAAVYRGILRYLAGEDRQRTATARPVWDLLSCPPMAAPASVPGCGIIRRV